MSRSKFPNSYFSAVSTSISGIFEGQFHLLLGQNFKDRKIALASGSSTLGSYAQNGSQTELRGLPSSHTINTVVDKKSVMCLWSYQYRSRVTSLDLCLQFNITASLASSTVNGQAWPATSTVSMVKIPLVKRDLVTLAWPVITTTAKGLLVLT